MKIRVGIVFEFRIAETWRENIAMALHVIRGYIHEVIESKLPEGWAMKVHNMTIDDVPVKNFNDV